MQSPYLLRHFYFAHIDHFIEVTLWQAGDFFQATLSQTLCHKHYEKGDFYITGYIPMGKIFQITGQFPVELSMRIEATVKLTERTRKKKTA